MTSNHAAKIKALLGKTIENGATEAEAIAAAIKARELMDKYDIDLTTLDMKAEGFGEHVYTTFSMTPEARAMNSLGRAVARFTETKVYVSENGSKIHYFGLKSDAIFAGWLNDTLVAFVVRGAEQHVKEWKAAQWRPDAAATKIERMSFVIACSERIAKRLNEESDKRVVTQQAPGKGLVAVSKNQLVTEEFTRLHPRLNKGRERHVRLSGSGVEAGRRAGDTANWNKPVNEEGTRRLT